MFILSGAFVGIETIIEKRIRKNSNIGFGSKLIKLDERDELVQKVIASDVIQFGLIPELVGRLPVIATLEKLDETCLKNILTGIKNNSPLSGSIEVNSVIVEAQKNRIKTIADLKQITNQVLNSNQKTILLAIYNNQNQRRYIGIKLD